MFMHRNLVVSVPPDIRAIFARWGEHCDPAPLGAPGADPRLPARLYRPLAAAPGPAPVARRALARIYADAVLNMEYGQFAELRREGAAVFPWIVQVLAADPVLRRQLD